MCLLACQGPTCRGAASQQVLVVEHAQLMTLCQLRTGLSCNCVPALVMCAADSSPLLSPCCSTQPLHLMSYSHAADNFMISL